MAKVKKGGSRGGNKYVHNHTYNANARESNERKTEKLNVMEVKRHQNCVNKNMKIITEYLPLEAIAYKKQKVGMWDCDFVGLSCVSADLYHITPSVLLVAVHSNLYRDVTNSRLFGRSDIFSQRCC